jgi:RecB family exonuclease
LKSLLGEPRSAAKDPGSTDEALELTRATFVGEETIRISGQIDRVDLASDNTLIAYDYKLSVGSTKEDIRTGRSLQIPIYLEALEKLILPVMKSRAVATTSFVAPTTGATKVSTAPANSTTTN